MNAFSITDSRNRTWSSEEAARVTVFTGDGVTEVGDLQVRRSGDVYRVNSVQYGLSFEIWVERSESHVEVCIPNETIREDGCCRIKDIALAPQLGSAREGEPGYLVLPLLSGVLCEFHDKQPARNALRLYTYSAGSMAMFGCVYRDAVLSAIITSGQCDASIGFDTAWGAGRTYSAYALFHFREFADEAPLGENLTVRYYPDYPDKPSYVQVARRYRSYKMEECGIRTLAERGRDNKELKYSTYAMQLRLRLAWKPVPSPVPDQTPETEPPVKVAMTFDRVRDVVDGLRSLGIDQAELCLVGWNRKGHDGRYPQILPVEETLGGEEKLRSLIRYTQDAGYQIVAHDLTRAMFRISEDWDEEPIALTHDGNQCKSGGPNFWSGGRTYYLCPKRAYEKYVLRNVRTMKALGFHGVHYTDVLSIAGPSKCFHPDHPINRREGAQWINRILETHRENFGGSSSEGFLDFCAESLDRALTIEGKEKDLLAKEYVDRAVPLLPIVYHGLVSYSLSHISWNCIVRNDRRLQLRCIEYGSIPQIYFYGNFTAVSEWQTTDIRADDDEILADSLRKIKETHDMFKGNFDLQEELIENHEQVAEGIMKTDYANGISVIVNYTEEPFAYQGHVVGAMDFISLETK